MNGLKQLVRTGICLAALSVAAGFFGAGEARAHRRDFPFTYDWRQPGKGEKEIELHTRLRDRDDSWEQQIEFEYGISKRWAVAPYVVFEKEPGSGLKYHEWKLETRYQLGEYAAGKVLPGLYLEYAKPKGEKGEIEGKIILSRFDEGGGNLSLNLIAERSLESGAKWEKEYSLGYARPLGKDSKMGWRGGGEIIRDGEGRINVGPVVNFIAGKGTYVSTGYYFAGNKKEGNKGEFRLLLEHEWF